jgi:hypothetical protein
MRWIARRGGRGPLARAVDVIWTDLDDELLCGWVTVPIGVVFETIPDRDASCREERE